jgi:hypothetical protein
VIAVGPITALVMFLMAGSTAPWLAFLLLSPLAPGAWLALAIAR